jgi:hypothetical protein
MHSVIMNIAESEDYRNHLTVHASDLVLVMAMLAKRH